MSAQDEFLTRSFLQAPELSTIAVANVTTPQLVKNCMYGLCMGDLWAGEYSLTYGESVVKQSVVGRRKKLQVSGHSHEENDRSMVAQKIGKNGVFTPLSIHKSPINGTFMDRHNVPYHYYPLLTVGGVVWYGLVVWVLAGWMNPLGTTLARVSA